MFGKGDDQPAHPPLHHAVVIAGLGITGDQPRTGCRRWRHAGVVIQSQGDDGTGAGQEFARIGSPCHARLGEPGEAVHQPVVNAAHGDLTISIEAGGIGNRDQVEADFTRQPAHQLAQVGGFRVAVFGHAHRFSF